MIGMSARTREPVPIIGPRSDDPRRIALVAHDNKKVDLLEWARFNRDLLAEHRLFGTGTIGSLIRDELALPVTLFRSGQLGGDQQLGARITEGEIDLVLFFWDPLEPQPHDPDVRALLRIAVVWNRIWSGRRCRGSGHRKRTARMSSVRSSRTRATGRDRGSARRRSR
jgi:methylglyoxal synthase